MMQVLFPSSSRFMMLQPVKISISSSTMHGKNHHQEEPFLSILEHISINAETSQLLIQTELLIHTSRCGTCLKRISKLESSKIILIHSISRPWSLSMKSVIWMTLIAILHSSWTFGIRTLALGNLTTTWQELLLSQRIAWHLDV